MKVVQVLPALEGGGVEQGTLEIARALVRAGHESVVVSAGGRLVATLQREGSRHVCWNIGRKHPATLLQIGRLRRWLALEQPAILHVRSRLPAWVCWRAWRRLRVRPRLVTTVHGLYSVNAYSEVMTRGERVAVVSDTARRYVTDNYPAVDASRLVRIYRGVDKRRYRHGFQPAAAWLAQWRAQYPNLAEKRLITLPGRLTRLKGHTDFIAALELLRAQQPDVAGVVVGAAEPKHRAYEEALRQRAPWLTFTGHRADLREIMAVSAAVVSFSTHPESFGRTVLEALSLGTPVIGYDHGGVGEILAQVFPPGRTPPGDWGAAAARLTDVLANPETLRGAIRDHGFTVERMCAETLALYDDLAGAAG